MWHYTCEQVLGKQKTQHKEWVSADTLQKLEERRKKKEQLNASRTRAKRARAQEEYTEAEKRVKTGIKKDKKDFVENLAEQVEEAAGQRNLKDLHMITKKLANKFQQTEKPVRDKNGHFFEHDSGTAGTMGRTLPRVAKPTSS